MSRGIVILAALAVGHTSQASAQGGLDGYNCTVQAFSNLGGIHGVGTGEVTLSADAAYRPARMSFSYSVSDRVSGWGRMSATWDLLEESPDLLGPIQSLRLHFPDGLGAAPVSLIITLDESVSAPLAVANRVGRGVGGRINAVMLRVRDGPVPELRGHGSLSYALNGAASEPLASDTFLLPDWRRNRAAIRSALARARAMARRRECDPFIVIGP